MLQSVLAASGRGGQAMRTISRNTNWGKVARGYFLAGLAFAFVWAMLLSSLV